MANGTTRPIADRSQTEHLRNGAPRQVSALRADQVLAHWSVIKPAYRITLEDGTELVAGADHRYLTERGWKFVTGPYGPRAGHTSRLQQAHGHRSVHLRAAAQ